MQKLDMNTVAQGINSDFRAEEDDLLLHSLTNLSKPGINYSLSKKAIIHYLIVFGNQ